MVRTRTMKGRHTMGSSLDRFSAGYVRRVLVATDTRVLDVLLIKTPYAYGGAASFQMMPARTPMLTRKVRYHRSFGFPMVLHLWEEDTHVRFTSPNTYLEVPARPMDGVWRYAGMLDSSPKALTFDVEGDDMRPVPGLEGLRFGRVSGEIFWGMERHTIEDALMVDFEGTWKGRSLLWVLMDPVSGRVRGAWGTSRDGKNFRFQGEQVLPMRSSLEDTHLWKGPDWTFVPSSTASMNHRLLFTTARQVCDLGTLDSGSTGVFAYGEYGA